MRATRLPGPFAVWVAQQVAKDPTGLDERQKEVLAYEWKFGSTGGRHYVACRNFSFATKLVQVKVSNDHTDRP